MRVIYYSFSGPLDLDAAFLCHSLKSSSQNLKVFNPQNNLLRTSWESLDVSPSWYLAWPLVASKRMFICWISATISHDGAGQRPVLVLHDVVDHREGWRITETVDFFGKTFYGGGSSLPAQNLIAGKFILKLEKSKSLRTAQVQAVQFAVCLTHLQCSPCSSKSPSRQESWEGSLPRPAASVCTASTPRLGWWSPASGRQWSSRTLRRVPCSEDNMLQDTPPDTGHSTDLLFSLESLSGFRISLQPAVVRVIIRRLQAVIRVIPVRLLVTDGAGLEPLPDDGLPLWQLRGVLEVAGLAGPGLVAAGAGEGREGRLHQRLIDDLHPGWVVLCVTLEAHL